jgi:hypothetical protein
MPGLFDQPQILGAELHCLVVWASESGYLLLDIMLECHFSYNIEAEYQRTHLIELHTMCVRGGRMAVDVVAFLRLEVISIVRVRVIKERVL